MTHEIMENFYFIHDKDGNIILQIHLTEEPNNQIIIRTDTEVYAGPISFLSFSKIDTKN